MEGERSGSVVPNYELQVSFSAATPAPVPIHDMGFVQFEDHHHHNDHHDQHNVYSFLAPSSQQSTAAGAGQLASSAAQPLTTGSASTAATGSNSAMGFCHGDLVGRPSWNNSEQMVKKRKNNKFYVSFAVSFF